jgi:septum site-determining protein MinC
MGIKIKGKTDGIFEIDIQLQSSYADLRNALQEKLSKNKDFFSGAGAKVIFTGRPLSEAQKKDLRRMLNMDYDIINVAFEDETAEPLEGRNIGVKHSLDSEAENGENTINLVSKNYFNAKSIFISHTIRSGQRVECEGDIVVLGDVNDGAEVIAGGSVAVMGNLRGLVHAGAMGRSDVVVAANALIPKRLRISGKIAVFPENKEANAPEMAEYKQGTVVIRPLRPQQKMI